MRELPAAEPTDVRKTRRDDSVLNTVDLRISADCKKLSAIVVWT
jgi:hypothetical protein